MITQYKVTGWRHEPSNKTVLLPYQVDFDDIDTDSEKELKRIYERGFELICKQVAKEKPHVILIDQITLWRVNRFGFFNHINI